MIPRRFPGSPETPKKPPTPESVLKRAVVKYLRMTGYGVEINVQGFGSRNGRPDLEASKKGRTIRVETKSPEHWVGKRHYPAGKLRPDQEFYVKWLSQYGILTIITADFEEFVRDLAEVERRLFGEERTKRLC